MHIHTDEATLDHALIFCAILFARLGYSTDEHTILVNDDQRQGCDTLGQSHNACYKPAIHLTVGDYIPNWGDQPVMTYILPNSYTAIRRVAYNKINTAEYLVVTKPGSAITPHRDMAAILDRPIHEGAPLDSAAARRALDAGILPTMPRPSEAVALVDKALQRHTANDEKAWALMKGAN